MATPLASPPPPRGTITRARSGTCSSSSSPSVPWPAITSQVVERVNEGQALGLGAFARGDERVHDRLPHQRDVRPQRGGRLHLGDRGAVRHEHLAAHAAGAGRVGHRLGVVAGARCHDALARSRRPAPASFDSAPRSLNDPVRCRFSALTTTVLPVRSLSVRELSSGVSRTTPAPACAARRISSGPTVAGARVESVRAAPPLRRSRPWRPAAAPPPRWPRAPADRIRRRTRRPR